MSTRMNQNIYLQSLHNCSLLVQYTLPPSKWFEFPPSSLPETLPPPQNSLWFMYPFTSALQKYNTLLSPAIPFTVIIVYVALVIYINNVNTTREFQPWRFSTTPYFKAMVLTHNAILAIYSGWTFVGMVNNMSKSVVSPSAGYGVAGTVDSLCKLHGKRGIGSADTYDSLSNAWRLATRPDNAGHKDLETIGSGAGRIWNEGLAFYGWLFYFSKFYEIVDTMIILLKGKKSSMLQTYHHSGAILCMWAGMRYMSPPIWLFVFLNSFIHTIMYTFYFITSTGFMVPLRLKRTLTTMQIAQLVTGTIYASAHLFIKYQVPLHLLHVGDFGSGASPIKQDHPLAVPVNEAIATRDVTTLLKQFTSGAASSKALAEILSDGKGCTSRIGTYHAAQDLVGSKEICDQSTWVNCLDTSGQTFAVWLNCLYLASLTWLFVKFFTKSYVHRVKQSGCQEGASVSEKNEMRYRNPRLPCKETNEQEDEVEMLGSKTRP